jgi:hypothetical protein
MKIIGFRLALVASAVLSLSACTLSDLRLSPDFGDAEREDVAAQISDPDAQYAGLPAPGSNGARVGLAQSRYEKNQVIQPSTTTASSAASIGNADNGGGAPGATGGTGASAGIAPAGP